MATTIITKNGSGAPTADDLSVGELAVDLTNKRLYSKNSSNAVIELGVNAAADTTFGDNVKAVFGDGSDLQIYHTGTYSLIADTSGTGPLRVVTNTFQLNNAADTENMINAAEGGAVTLYNAGNAKLATTSTGVDVTGTVTADGLTVESSSDPTLITLRHTGNTSGFVIKNFSGAESQLVNVDNGPMVFKTNDTEAMRIDSSGNVGIGITPQSFAKLQVKTATDRNVSIFDNAAGATICGITDAGASTSLRLAGSNLIFTGDGGGGAEAMRIDTSGNVGIGTQSPVSPLTTSIGAGSAGSLNNQIAMTHSGASNSYHIKTIRATANDEPAGLAFVENTTERMRIDSSGNLLVGGITNDTPGLGDTDVGASFRADGASFVSRTLSDTSGSTLYVNRNTNNGNLVQFQKDGTTVGSIGSVSFGVAGISFVNPTYGGIRTADYRINPVNGSGADFDNSIDLGAGGNRFKDLYLSGGLYVGGTGAANKLDDYEEGTFTATLTGSTTAPTTSVTATAYYTKIGNLVTLNVNFNNKDVTGVSGNITVTGFPFTASDTYQGSGWCSRVSSATDSVRSYISTSGSIILIDSFGNAVTWATAGTGTYAGITITCRVS